MNTPSTGSARLPMSKSTLRGLGNPLLPESRRPSTPPRGLTRMVPSPPPSDIRRSLEIVTSRSSTLQNTTICLAWLVLDRSGSMQVHGQKPREELNKVLADLRTAEGASKTYLGVVTFADTPRIELPPQLAASVPDLASYEAMGTTLLFGTVADILRFSGEFKAVVKERDNVDVLIVVTVLSDGEATDIQRGLECYNMAKAARESGADLNAIGLGIDGSVLAARLGFDPNTAFTAPNTAEGLTTSMGTMTGMTSKSMYRTMVGDVVTGGGSVILPADAQRPSKK